MMTGRCEPVGFNLVESQRGPMSNHQSVASTERDRIQWHGRPLLSSDSDLRFSARPSRLPTIRAAPRYAL